MITGWGSYAFCIFKTLLSSYLEAFYTIQLYPPHTLCPTQAQMCVLTREWNKAYSLTACAALAPFLLYVAGPAFHQKSPCHKPQRFQS